MSAHAFARRVAGIAAMLLWSITAAAQPAAAPAAPPDQFFDSNGVRIRYVEQGQGPAIVLMHGYTGTLDRHFIANGVFANFAKDYRVIAMDLRGHGKSDKPHDPNAYGETMAGDVVRLLDHVKIPRAHVLGYLLGASDRRPPGADDASGAADERCIRRQSAVAGGCDLHGHLC